MLLKVAGARSAEQPGMREITREKGRNFDAGLPAGEVLTFWPAKSIREIHIKELRRLHEKGI